MQALVIFLVKLWVRCQVAQILRLPRPCEHKTSANVGFNQPAPNILTKVHGQIWGKIEIFIKDKIDLRMRNDIFNIIVLCLFFSLSPVSIFDASCSRQSERN